MVGRRTGQNVDAIHLQCFANIRENLGRFALHILDCGCALLANTAVDINNRTDLGARVFVESTNVFVASTIHARDANTQFVVGADFVVLRPRAMSKSSRANSNGSASKLATR